MLVQIPSRLQEPRNGLGLVIPVKQVAQNAARYHEFLFAVIYQSGSSIARNPVT
jgi:hypothetical protein